MCFNLIESFFAVLHIAFTSSIISLYSFLSAFLFVRLFSVYYSWYLHICFTRKHCSSWRAFVVTSDRNHRKIHLFNIIQILNKFKIFKHHGIGNFSNNIKLRKQNFLSQGNFTSEWLTCHTGRDLIHRGFILTTINLIAH